MKNLIITTTVGALVGAAVSFSIPYCSTNKFIRKRNKVIRKGKRAKTQLIKRIAGIIYKIA